MPIIKGTTPTITFNFSEILTEDIAKAILTISQYGRTAIKRDLSSAITEERSISWKLRQDETLKLTTGTESEIICDWLLNDGTRGRSIIRKESVEHTGVNEVI